MPRLETVGAFSFDAALLLRQERVVGGLVACQNDREVGATPSLDIGYTSEHRECRRYFRCQLPTCDYCNAHKGRRIRRAVLHNTSEKSQNLWRLTLTVLASDDLRASIDHLYDSAKRLRRTKYWRQHVRGGYQRLHCNYSRNAEHWTPHFDLLLEADALDQEELKLLWRQATGDSFIIRLQKVGASALDRFKLSSYQLKSPCAQLGKDDNLRATYADATRGRRRFQRFGQWVNTAKDKTRWTTPAKASEKPIDASDADAPTPDTSDRSTPADRPLGADPFGGAVTLANVAAWTAQTFRLVQRAAWEDGP